MTYKTTGTCSQAIDVEVENGIITHVKFIGGCNGNTQGVAALVTGMKATEDAIEFNVEGWEDSSITLELEPDTEYKVLVDGTNIGKMKTNLAGKLVLSVEINPGQVLNVQVDKI